MLDSIQIDPVAFVIPIGDGFPILVLEMSFCFLGLPRHPGANYGVHGVIGAAAIDDGHAALLLDKLRNHFQAA